MAGFGESLTTTGPISGEVVYIGRGCDPAFQTSVPPQPLDPYLADPAGKIAIIDRGSCEFQAKVRKAEVNGAIMVIVANNIAGPPTAMGGANPLIEIPSVMVSQSDGTEIDRGARSHDRQRPSRQRREAASHGATHQGS